MTVEIRSGFDSLIKAPARIEQERPEDAMFKQLIEEHLDPKREQNAGTPDKPAPETPLSETTEQAAAGEADDAADAAAGPTRTELDAQAEANSGLLINGEPVAALGDEAASTLVGEGFDPAVDAAANAVNAAARLAGEGAKARENQPMAFSRPGEGAATTEKSTAAQALRNFVSASGEEAQPQQQALKAQVTQDAAPTQSKPNQALAATTQAAAQKAQEVQPRAAAPTATAAADAAEINPATTPKLDGAGVQADAQPKPQQGLTQAQLVAAAASDKAAQQAAMQAAAAKAAKPAATPKPDMPAPPQQAAQNSQPTQNSQQNFAQALGQANKGAETAKSDQASHSGQARNTHQSNAVADQVAIKIRKGFGQNGVDRIQIHLKPAELGRVDVEMRVTAEGRAAVVVQAEKPETLEMLQRESKTLEQALKDAGLAMDDGSLQFGRHGEGRFAGRGDLNDFGREAAEAAAEAEAEALLTPSLSTTLAASSESIDIRV